MDKLIFTFEGRLITVPLEVISVRYGIYEYHLLAKDKRRVFVFTKHEDKWAHHYGHMRDNLKQVILSALIMKFESDVVTTFMLNGERQIVKVRAVYGIPRWSVQINNFYVAFIDYDTATRNFSWKMQGKKTWLLPRHMEKFITMIKSGKIETPPEIRGYYMLPMPNDKNI